MTDAWLSIADVAGLLGMSQGYTRESCREGRFPGAVNVGRGWLIPSRSVAYFRRRRNLPVARFMAVAARIYEEARLRVETGVARASFEHSPYSDLAVTRLGLGK